MGSVRVEVDLVRGERRGILGASLGELSHMVNEISKAQWAIGKAKVCCCGLAKRHIVIPNFGWQPATGSCKPVTVAIPLIMALHLSEKGQCVTLHLQHSVPCPAGP